MKINKGITWFQSFTLAIIGLLVIGFLLRYTRSFVIPFTFSIILSFFFDPLMRFMEKKSIPSLLSSLLVLLMVLTTIGGLGLLLYVIAASVTSQLPQYTEKWNTLTNQMIGTLGDWANVDLKKYFDTNGENGIFSLFSPDAIFNTARKSMGSVGTFFSSLILTIVFMVFLLNTRRMWVKKVTAFIEGEKMDVAKAKKVLSSITSQIQSYLFLKTIISIVTGAVFGAVAWLYGLDFPLFWAFLAFVLNFIPSIGPMIATIPAILIAFIQFDSNGYALLVSLSMSLVQFLSGNVFEPMIMGERLNLNIVVVLLSLFAWSMIWGFVGMILAVPLTAILNIILYNSGRYRHISHLLSK